MKCKVRFYIVLTVDIPCNHDWSTDVGIQLLLPETIKTDMKRRPKNRKVWSLTEYHMDDEFGSGTLYRHWKYTGELSADEFKVFVEEIGFYSACDTMGILNGFGVIPAISLDNDCGADNAFINAYVCPMLDDGQIKREMEGHSDAQRQAIGETVLYPIGESLMEALKGIADYKTEDDAWEVLMCEHVVDLRQMLFV